MKAMLAFGFLAGRYGLIETVEHSKVAALVIHKDARNPLDNPRILPDAHDATGVVLFQFQVFAVYRLPSLPKVAQPIV